MYTAEELNKGYLSVAEFMENPVTDEGQEVLDLKMDTKELKDHHFTLVFTIIKEGNEFYRFKHLFGWVNEQADEVEGIGTLKSIYLGNAVFFYDGGYISSNDDVGLDTYDAMFKGLGSKAFHKFLIKA